MHLQGELHNMCSLELHMTSVSLAFDGNACVKREVSQISQDDVLHYDPESEYKIPGTIPQALVLRGQPADAISF